MKPVIKIALVAILSALVLVAQIALAFLPNVELVTLLLIIYSLVFPLSMALSIAFIFVTLNWLFWGFGDWIFGYYVIWPLLVIVTKLLAPIFKSKADYWALFAGAFGLVFGLLFTFHHMIFYGVHTGYAYWIRGLSFDVVHCFSNYILTIILFSPLLNILKKLTTRLEESYGNHN